MKNQDLQIKIEETFNSIEGIQSAEANPFLLTRVLEQMKLGVHGFVKPSLVWQTVISFILVIGLNICIGIYCSNANSSSKKTVSVDSGYFTNHQYNY